MRLENLYPSRGAIKRRKRIGRGQGSGKGGTSTRGHKGAKSRSGFSYKLGFEGGQLPFQRRIPKYGFKQKRKKDFFCINLGLLQSYVKTPNLFKKEICIKVLGSGTLSDKLKVYANKFSQSSIEKIKSVGGEIIHIL